MSTPLPSPPTFEVVVTTDGNYFTGAAYARGPVAWPVPLLIDGNMVLCQQGTAVVIRCIANGQERLLPLPPEEAYRWTIGVIAGWMPNTGETFIDQGIYTVPPANYMSRRGRSAYASSTYRARRLRAGQTGW